MSNLVSDLIPQDRPREKLALKGLAALSDLELLQIVIGSGSRGASVIQLSHQVMAKLKPNPEVTLNELATIRGLSFAKASAILASIEFGQRRGRSGELIIDSALKVLPFVSEYANSKQEHVIAIYVDGAQRLISKKIISIGTLSNSLIHPREVFAEAVAGRAAGVFVVHNHPSGNCEPSDPDRLVTNNLIKAGEILGIKLLDHIIITSRDHFSCKENHLI